MNPLQHVAIIPDGNRRWGKENKINNIYSLYEKGANNFHAIMNFLFDQKISHVTFWLSSLDNLKKRSYSSKNAMNKLYYKKIKELLHDEKLVENRVRVTFAGLWRLYLDKKTIDIIDQLVDKTKSYTNMTLTLLIAYDGRIERGEALQLLLKADTKKEFTVASAVTLEKKLRSYSWTGELPDVDLLIRTGSWEDPHNSSDFLSLLVGNSQYDFPKSFWPDFSEEELKSILDNYTHKDRRKGR